MLNSIRTYLLILPYFFVEDWDVYPSGKKFEHFTLNSISILRLDFQSSES